MNKQTESVLFQVAAYLALVAKGIPASPTEAAELLEKIGKILADPEA